jgi:hypothetical protein
VHSTPSSDSKPWEAAYCDIFNFNMGEAIKRRNFDVRIGRAA